MQHMNTWIGKSLVSPEPGSEQDIRGYSGAYGLIACCAKDMQSCVALIAKELSENSVILTGFDWIMPYSMLSRDLAEDEARLISNLAGYPVQFHDFHWFKKY